MLTAPYMSELRDRTFESFNGSASAGGGSDSVVPLETEVASAADTDMEVCSAEDTTSPSTDNTKLLQVLVNCL